MGRKKLISKLKKQREQVASAIKKYHSALLGLQSKMTESAAVSWVFRSPIEEISDELQVPTKDQKKFRASLVSGLDVLKIACSEEYGSALEKLAHMNAYPDSSKFPQELKRLVEQVQGETFPEDIFVVSEIPGIDMAGAVIMLRELIGVPYGSIKYRLSEVCTSEEHLRAARLSPQIKYAVSQAFGNLYSKIGLSPEYEEKKKSTLIALTLQKWTSA